tara:strand:- start:692 stop:1717 length:1026 start_codon:yes stop_codon:yes gene_type:complete
MDDFKDKTILITGGTGSFGNKLARKLIKNSQFKKIVIASRDEKKQHEMRLELGDEKLEYKIADVRDRERINEVMRGIDYVFHSAALKHVPACEYDPYEAVKTNIIGSNNVFSAAVENRVKRVLALSTDKSVYPINAMGISKAMMERLVMSFGRSNENTIFNVVRYGNVICSRGSVIPLFLKNLSMGLPILVTDKTMTRFLLSLDQAVELVEYALRNGENGEIFVKKAPAANIITILKACTKLLNKTEKPFKLIGIREGEKIHEVLINSEEFNRTKDEGEFYKINSSAKKSYFEFLDHGKEKLKKESYTSELTTQLNENEVLEILKRNNDIKLFLNSLNKNG